MNKISNLIDPILTNQMKELLALRSLWKRAVISDISKISSVYSYNLGVLKVKVFDNIWNEELKYLKPEILKRLNEDSETLKITSNLGIKNITFKYEPQRDSFINKEEDKKEEYEITDHIKSYIEKSSSLLTDPILKEKWAKMLEARFRHEDFYEWIKK